MKIALISEWLNDIYTKLTNPEKHAIDTYINDHPWQHDLIATTVIANASWRDEQVPDSNFDTMIEESVEQTIRERMMKPLMVWFQELRDNIPIFDIYDQSVVDRTPDGLVAGAHAHLITTLLRNANPDDNTVVVTPMHYTVIQSASMVDSRFMINDQPTSEFWPPRVGTIVDGDRKLNVYLDQYAGRDDVILLGSVEPNPENRPLAIVRPSRNWISIGVTDDYLRGWKEIGFVVDSLRFI